MPLRVLIADDNSTMSSAIARMLKENSDIEVVGVSTSYAQTLDMAATLKPDVVLLDLLMPDERDFSTEEIKLHLLHNAGCVLAISIWNEPDAKERADRLGAKLLLDKAELFAELKRAISFLSPPR
jgi:DNA-binding NarL/FixJ family response regulator